MKRRNTPTGAMGARWRWLALVVVLMLFTAACGDDDISNTSATTAREATTAAEGEPILIGAINDISGFCSSFGEPELQGQRLAVQAINDAGGINGRPLELVERDSQADANRAVQFFEELAGDPNIAALVGFCTSTESLAVKDRANEVGIAQVCACGAADFLAEPLTYNYRALYGDRYLIQGIFQFAEETLGATDIALLMQNDAFGQGAETLLREQLPESMTIVAAESFAPTDSDVTAQLQTIEAADPDLIVSWATGLVSAVIDRNRFDLGMTDVPLIGPQNFGTNAVREAAGATAEGVLVASFVAEDDPKPGPQTEFAGLYLSELGRSLDAPAMIGWDQIYLVAAALKGVAPASGPVDRAALNDALQSVDYQGAVGQFVLSEAVHEIVDPDSTVIGVIEDGQWVRYQG